MTVRLLFVKTSSLMGGRDNVTRIDPKLGNTHKHRKALQDVPGIFVIFGAAITVFVKEGGNYMCSMFKQ